MTFCMALSQIRHIDSKTGDEIIFAILQEGVHIWRGCSTFWLSKVVMMDQTDTRRLRLEQLRERFVAASLGTRSLRLIRGTRSGALDLHRLAMADGKAFRGLVDVLGVESRDAVALCDMRPKGGLEDFAEDLSVLAHAAREERLESGAEDLAVGWPFIEGKSDGGTWIRGPLFLFPVSVETSKTGRLAWLLRPAGPGVLNEPLVEFLAREAGVRLTLEEVWGEGEGVRVGEEAWQGVCQYLHSLGFPLVETPEFLPALSGFEGREREERESAPVGEFRLEHQVVLGRFPVSASNVINDYDVLLAGTVDVEVLGLANELLLVDEDVDWVEDRPLEERGNAGKRLLGAWQRWQIFASDESQDAVFRFVEGVEDEGWSGAGLVVQGPPGTGKSQLITNLVGAGIARGERILVVCSKRAALDVVAARLASVGLGEPIALVHDVGRDRNEVCAALDGTLSQLEDHLDGADLRRREILQAQSAHERALNRLSARLEHSSAAFERLAISEGGRPCLAELQERALDDDGRPLPDLRHVAGEVSQEQLFAGLPRLESLASKTSRVALPHPLGMRGRWENYGPDEVEKFYEMLRELRTLVEDLRRRQGATMTPAESVEHDEVWLRVAPFVDMLEYERALFDEFLLFWTWMDGEAEGGEWHRVMATLKQAREELGGVPYELVVSPRELLETWIAELRELAALQDAWYRFLSPRFWKLRKLPGQILQRCVSLSEDGQGLPVDVVRLCEQGIGWQELIGALPSDNPLFDFGFSGRPEEIDGAIEALRRQHTNTRCLHDLHGAFASRGGPYEAFPELGPEMEDLVTDVAAFRAAVSDRAMARGSREVDEILLRLGSSAGLDESVCEEIRGDFARGSFDAIVARLDGLEQVRGAVDEAIEVDRLMAEDAPWIRSFLKGWRLDEGQGGRPGEEAMLAMERAWHANLVRDRGWSEIEAPLVDGEYLDRLREDLERCQELAGQGMSAQYVERMTVAAGQADRRRSLQQLAAEVRKKRHRPSLRQLTERFWDRGLSLVRPVWFCSPEAVSALFPLESGFFDLVIFDEASQCPVEAALPALVRSKRVIIAGDDQQMPPSRFFQVGMEAEEEDSTLLETRSILELSRAVFTNTTLRWHYRSRHEELIAFSNRAFYGGRLITAPVVEEARVADVEGIHLRRVKGIWQDQTNLAEAQEVLAIIARLLRTKTAQGKMPSIGVVTFNRRQAELIETLIDSRATIDAVFRQGLSRDAERPVVDQIFVRNLENVQGDERDVIIMSTGYGPSEPGGRVHARFGPIGLEGGEKRLNVAITRARQGIWLVTSMEASALNVGQTRNVGPKLLQRYIAFVEAHTARDRTAILKCLDEAQHLGGGQGVTGENRRTRRSRGTGERVLRELGEALVDRGFLIEYDVGLGSQCLDLTVRSCAEQRSRLGIDCTRFLNHPDSLSRDVHGQAFWQRLGWTLLRVSPAMWLHSREATLTMIEQLVHRVEHAPQTMGLPT